MLPAACALNVPSGATSQTECVVATTRPTATGTPPFDDYDPLFRHEGVVFYSRVDNGATPAEARLIVHNGNAQPVEVSFTLAREVGEGPVVEQSLDRRCVVLGAGEYVAFGPAGEAQRSAGGPVRAVRVRHVNVMTLPSAAGPAESAASGSTVPARAPSPIAAPTRPRPPVEDGDGPVPGRGPRIPAARRAASEPGDLPVTSHFRRSDPAPPAAPVPATRPDPGTPAESDAGSPPFRGPPVVAETIVLGFRWIFMVAFTLAGAALALPVAASLVLLLVRTPIALLRRGFR